VQQRASAIRHSRTTGTTCTCAGPRTRLGGDVSGPPGEGKCCFLSRCGLSSKGILDTCLAMYPELGSRGERKQRVAGTRSRPAAVWATEPWYQAWRLACSLRSLAMAPEYTLRVRERSGRNVWGCSETPHPHPTSDVMPHTCELSHRQVLHALSFAEGHCRHIRIALMTGSKGAEWVTKYAPGHVKAMQLPAPPACTHLCLLSRLGSLRGLPRRQFRLLEQQQRQFLLMR
jgi:hypothetical protein